MEISVMQDILGRNDAVAAKTRQLLLDNNILALNLLGSPGAGKTTLLEKTLALLKTDLRIAVIEGDLFTRKDADRIEKLGIPVIQVNTSGGCHLDAVMVAEAVAAFDLKQLDLLIIENVGNLVCPAEFELGESVRATVLSVTEGDDKPLKYPLIFKETDITVISKTDLLPFTNFNLDGAVDDLSKLNPTGKVLPVSAISGEGLQEWADWLRNKVAALKEGK